MNICELRLNKSIWLLALVPALDCGSSTSGVAEYSAPVTSSNATATLAITSDWGTGYCANVTVANTGSSSSTSWTVDITLNGSTITQIWSANDTVSGGTAVVTPLSYDAVIAPGFNTIWGFCATPTGSARAALASVTLNGAGTADTGAPDSATDTGVDSGHDSATDTGIADTHDSASTDTGIADTHDSAPTDTGVADTHDSAPTDTGVADTHDSAPTDTGSDAGAKAPGTAQAGDISINPATIHQIVDGFGQADVWQGSSSSTMQTLLFDPVNGIGLTLLRIGIESASGTSVLMGNAAIADGQACVKFAGTDCKVWAAPWSPPASMKNNNNVDGNNGGTNVSGSTDTLKTADYDAWATLLAAFPAYYKAQSGVNLYAISAQNEPDFDPNYEACVYNAAQMVSFIDALGPKLAALNPPVKVLAAEPDNWGNLWGGDGYGPAIIADSNANNYVGPIATHDYGGTSAGTYARPAPPANNTHHVWETECTPGDTGAITLATMVYAAFATGGANAWHYWWTEAFIPNTASPPPQYYALGNFSKFVRPGYYRVDVTGAPTPSGTAPLVVAFTNQADATVVIVVVNGGGAQNVSFFVAGTAWPASVTPHVTTASSNLVAGTAITLTGARFSASLAAQSVTTFVGKP